MQKKNRRGFTLIELLAVIVILAIIALIAVPVIMNVITKARVSAFEDSAYGIVKAGEMYYTNALLEAEGMTGDKEFIISNGVFEGDALDVSGSLPSSGQVIVTSDGKVALAISNGEYCIRKATTESKVKAEKLSDIGNNCDYKTETSTSNPVFTTTTDGKAIPACITINRKCSAGTKVGVKVNDSETYDFYVMSEEGNNITLIMNKNLGGAVAWLSNDDYSAAGGEDLSNDGGACQIGGYCIKNDKGPLTALKALEERTASWTNIPETTYELADYSMTRTARARLITKTEAEGLGCTSSSGSCPTWLDENIGSVYRNYGYWTSSVSADSSYYAWYSGTNIGEETATGGSYGVRPVITIFKTIL